MCRNSNFFLLGFEVNTFHLWKGVRKSTQTRHNKTGFESSSGRNINTISMKQ